MNIQYILASASPRRREILTNVGISFEVMASDAPEIITEKLPDKMVMELAAIKSNDIKKKLENNALYSQTDTDCSHPKDTYDKIYVIGADTMVFINNRHLGKPSDEEDAFKMLKMLQGNTHQVITGVCVNELISGEHTIFAETTDVHVVTMTDEQIRNYISTGECMDKAGAYAIQGKFARYIKGIEGDYYNVVGFPVCRFCELFFC